jgi:hypothetical protein
MTSAAPFAVTAWGWGANGIEVAGEPTSDVSYGYPAGAGLRPVNDVDAHPVERAIEGRGVARQAAPASQGRPRIGMRATSISFTGGAASLE